MGELGEPSAVVLVVGAQVDGAPHLVAGLGEQAAHRVDVAGDPDALGAESERHPEVGVRVRAQRGEGGRGAEHLLGRIHAPAPQPVPAAVDIGRPGEERALRAGPDGRGLRCPVPMRVAVHGVLVELRGDLVALTGHPGDGRQEIRLRGQGRGPEIPGNDGAVRHRRDETRCERGGEARPDGSRGLHEPEVVPHRLAEPCGLPGLRDLAAFFGERPDVLHEPDGDHARD